jgi:hypothetical protein
MMRIALLSHSYHRITGSTDFLLEALRALGTVEIYFDESWAHTRADWVDSFQPGEFDCIVIFQAHECFQYINRDHPNIVFVPMYDAMIWHGAFYWLEIFQIAKVICFSSSLHQFVAARNPKSVYFQYYPVSGQHPKVRDYSVPRGYFWRRTNDISPKMIGTLTGNFRFGQFTLHDVPDPGLAVEDVTMRMPVNAALHRVTGWHVSEEQHLKDLSAHNIYFASRIREGIGFGFLKAMSMGLCVVAPDTGTHNEYIAQGQTGLLYKPENPEAVDLRFYGEIGLRARESMERGRRRWEAGLDRFLTCFAVPTVRFASWTRASAPETAGQKSADNPKLPTVAVVTVSLNAMPAIERTVVSVLAQEYPSLEYVICDGGSTDGTVDVIRMYQDRLASWTSRPDGGVYAAMGDSLGRVRSEWVLFMNAGDYFVSSDALRRLFERVPDDADVVYGHHLYRHADGAEELRLAANFSWLGSRLKEGNYDVQYPAGFPAHQATAIRTKLLRELKFDPMFQIAADHDVLWRAYVHGAEFFHADEVVSVYVSGGTSAQQMRRCKEEWCIIALKHVTRTGAARLKNCTNEELVEAVEIEHQYRSSRLSRRLRALRPIAPVDAIANRLRRLAIARRLRALGLPKPFAILRFGKSGTLESTHEVRGLAEPEEWGRWSEGEVVEIVFRQLLPVSFDLVIQARAFGPNARTAISVKVGDISQSMKMKGPRMRTYRLRFSMQEGQYRITLTIPHPVAPADLNPSGSSDQRKIGLGLISILVAPVLDH